MEVEMEKKVGERERVVVVWKWPKSIDK